MSNKIKMSQTEYLAIENKDSNYINNKGANLYKEETYDLSVEYYRLAAAMGNDQAIANLGYCYLYGRSIEQNTDLAIAYFKIASLKKNLDALYKLGDIYGSDKWGVKDTELSVYYYRFAADIILEGDWDKYSIRYNTKLHEYPSLCFALGRELSKNGAMSTDVYLSYLFLLVAKSGYETALRNGDSFYQSVYESVLRLLEDEQYVEVKDECSKFLNYENEDDDEDEDDDY